MGTQQNVLLIGASGYLGQFLLKSLKEHGYWVRVLVRPAKQAQFKSLADEVFVGEATQPETLDGLCDGIDRVCSSLGITRQKDGMTYMDVDFQANVNVLKLAEAASVSGFLYVSALNAQYMRQVEILKAKEFFVDTLKQSPIKSIVIRPNGFFSDMTEYFNFAHQGRVYLLGDGQCRSNPIHGADLAEFCMDCLSRGQGEYDVGGPDILSHEEIAELAFKALGKTHKITRLPIGISKGLKWFLKTFTSVKFYGPIEFFLSVMTQDMIAPAYGKETLKSYYQHLAQKLD